MVVARVKTNLFLKLRIGFLLVLAIVVFCASSLSFAINIFDAIENNNVAMVKELVSKQLVEDKTFDVNEVNKAELLS
jgi:hypothetical protein